MDRIEFFDASLHRRRFFGVAATGIAVAKLGLLNSANAQAVEPKATQTEPSGETGASFGPLKQIDAGPLNVGYVEAGPGDGPAVILLHGWPYDIHSFVDVAPLLASAGYRLIVPYLRGYGSTRFVSSDTVRNGQQSVVALDIIALMDALKIEKATLAGFDWGARTADVIAALWPERCKALVSVSGYLIGNQEAGKAPCPPRPSCNGGTNSTSLPNAVASATRNTVTTLRSSSGSSHRLNGSSTTQRSIEARRRSTIRIMSPSSFITIAGASLWLRGSRNMTT